MAEPQTINEKMGLQKEWFEEAKKITEETLPEFIRKLAHDYRHDYGTICHALAAGALAGAYALNNSSSGGITGFQSGFVMWGFVQEWLHIKGPAILLRYDDMLYPQSEYKFREIDKDTWEHLRTKVYELLAQDNSNTHPDVLAHWKSIARGVVPFGYTVKER